LESCLKSKEKTVYITGDADKAIGANNDDGGDVTILLLVVVIVTMMTTWW
jgi:hypothetical protein